MLVNNDVIYCDRCDFAARTSAMEGDFSYLLADGEVTWVRSRLGWCFECRTLRPTEDVDVARQETKLAALTQELADIDRRVKELASGPHGIHGRRDRREMESLLRLDHSDCTWRQGSLLRHLSFCRSRQAPARCLLCGSTNITDVDQFWNDGRTEYPRRLAFRHPECGGDFWVKPSETPSVSSDLISYYTPEGVFIREEKLGRKLPSEADSDL